ncbi:hypothetical protein EHEL_071635 [Encephalitozoon hellem ATCC 50504]|uniref:Uncharacterized protein n=1 Tax=Encephalitozoon hellem TaxID=27973 RepID=A0A9Q9C4R0_ENCHE|nr:uncharacterized protein EHEL_071635 [Encephalitozoon hellem ATCC 50504]AHL28953.1 hypothetical protein EHEL_071635 [Encephalitozoon hellem ATCC 50504]UTX43635.1 hypothetical protein GPU96_07g13990 [Encephalitozoon hellem]WEL39111.1 hypothetical protein PFJ87_07g01930 [Encephalitozoon hellem]
MEKKNKDLAKENTELKRKISTMKKTEEDLLKDRIKKEYFGFRMHKKISGELEKNIAAIENVLDSLKRLSVEIPNRGHSEVLKDKRNLKE